MSRLGPLSARVPADRRYARVMRMVTGSVATGAGLDIDRVDDAMLAVGEAFGLLVGLPGAESINCQAVMEAEGVDFALSVHPHPDAFPDPSWSTSLANRILTVTAGEVEYSPDDSAIRFRIAGNGEG